ncbi:IclR family transcriptional regulator [Variovorax gossypii]|uniref:IclR family transcriptional regulator n=1 Tax=Variovorax gossypii TaxID=1679495 RepID=A0A3S0J2F0_9BURK|nr:MULTISPECIES: IclR family transcriptional regulator [Variovorax]RTQ35565.1 IclR family transcriptional regulator [Variovorax gossypii]
MSSSRGVVVATTDKNENVRAVGRALEILLAFTAQDFELSASELLKRVDLSRPTLYRLLYTLQEHGFLISVGEPQRFRLGASVARLAHVWTSSLDLAAVAEPVLRRIWRATGETVAMFLPQRELRLCVAELPSPQPLNFKRGVGYTERIVRGATGRAILAYMGATAEEMSSYAKGTGINPKELEVELARTRKRGWASSHSELIPGAVAVAVPFFDRNAAVAGSIGVFGPEVRLGAERLKQITKLLQEESKNLSAMLGYGSKETNAA